MIILFDKSGSLGYAPYLVNREKESFTIIEGSEDSFISSQVHIKNNLKKEDTHYRIVLSMDEENLTQEQMIEIYNDWKELFFANYDPAEYELFSVIHWDDNKPHIHVGLIAHNLINDKELRISRGKTDIKRIDAVAEILNFKHDLKSAKTSTNLFKKTPEQTTRDRRIKKFNHQYHEVPDDIIHKKIESSAKAADSFKEFKELLTKEFPEVEFYPQKNHLGEGTIKIDPQHSFTSILLNQEWFNKNLKLIKSTPNLQALTFSIKRESESQYKKTFEDQNLSHKLHLNESSRKIHQGFPQHEIALAQIELAPLNDGVVQPVLDDEISPETLRVLKKVNLANPTPADITLLRETYLVEARKKAEANNLKLKAKDRKPLSELVPYDDKIKKLNPKTIINSLISDYLSNAQSKEEIKLLLKIANCEVTQPSKDNETPNVLTITKNNQSFSFPNSKIAKAFRKTNQDLSLDFQNQTLIDSIKNLNTQKRSSLNQIKALILNHTLKSNPQTQEDLTLFLESNSIQIKNHGSDYRHGEYLTLIYKSKSFRIYNKFLYDTFNNNSLNAQTNPLNPENINFPHESSDTLSTQIKEQHFGSLKPKTLQEYRLTKAYELDYEIINNDADFYIDPTPLRTKNNPHKIEDHKHKLIANKSLLPDEIAQSLINQAHQKNWKNITLGGDEFFHNQAIEALLSFAQSSPSHKNWIEQLSINLNNNPDILKIKNGKILTTSKGPSNPTAQPVTPGIPKSKDELEYEEELANAISICEYNTNKLKELEKATQILTQVRPSSPEPHKEYVKLLKAAAKLDDLEFFHQILNTLDLEVKIATKTKRSNKKYALITDKANPDNNIFINDEKTIELCDKSLEEKKEKTKKATLLLLEQGYYTRNQNLKTIEAKQKFLKKVYNKTFEETPLLNYKITNLSSSKSSKIISYYQKDSIIFDNNGVIEVKKSKNLEKTALAIIEIAKANNYNNLDIKASPNLKALISKHLNNTKPNQTLNQK